MKLFISVFCLLIAVSALTSVRSQPVNIDDRDPEKGEFRPEHCKFPKYSPLRRECALYKCTKDQTRVLVVPCPYSPCPNRLSYNEEEFSKPYPECCAPPVC